MREGKDEGHRKERRQKKRLKTPLRALEMMAEIMKTSSLRQMNFLLFSCLSSQCHQFVIFYFNRRLMAKDAVSTFFSPSSEGKKRDRSTG